MRPTTTDGSCLHLSGPSLRTDSASRATVDGVGLRDTVAEQRCKLRTDQVDNAAFTDCEASTPRPVGPRCIAATGRRSKPSAPTRGADEGRPETLSGRTECEGRERI